MAILPPATRPDQRLTFVLAGPPAGRDRGSRVLIWQLENGGWSSLEAGNLVALRHGLRPSASGWTGREIEHLRFLRAIVESGRLEG